jgi:hypothetical protein
MQQPEAREVVQKAVERAERDAAFRAALLSDPVRAVQAETGINVESGIDPGRLAAGLRSYFGAPGADGELDDDHLEAVAGGFSIVDLLNWFWPDSTGGDAPLMSMG